MSEARDLLIRLAIAGGVATKRELEEVGASVKGVGEAADQGATRARDASGRFVAGSKEAAKAAKDHEAALKTLSQASLVVGGAMLAGFGLAARAGMDFEKQMSGVAAATFASSTEMERLTASALKAGADTVFSASEAARAQTELAKAGVSTADILGGALTGALDLASAGQLDLGRAAEVAATTMTIFGLKGRDVAHVADVLAAAAGKSAADVEDIAQALNQAGLVARNFGLSLEDTNGVLALFAYNGLRGSDSGTSLKTMLQRLVPQSEEAASTMRALGIEVFDSSGKFVGIERAAEELKEGLSELSEQQRNTALQTIFGSDAVRAATILYKAGAAGVADWRGRVDDSGYAAEQAAKKLDNLAGDVEALGGSLETVFIKSTGKANTVLRGVTQEATHLVNAVGALPGPVLAGGAAVAGLAGAGLSLVGVVGTLAPKVQETQRALGEMGRASQFVGRNLPNIARGLAGGALGFALFLDAVGKATAAAERLRAELAADLDTTSLESITATAADVEARLVDLDAQWAEMGGSIEKIGRGFIEVLTPMKNTVIDNAEAAGVLSDALIKLRADATHAEENLWGIANATGLSFAEAKALAAKAGVDLTGTFTETRDAGVKAFGEIASEAGVTGNTLLALGGDSLQMSEDIVKAVTKAKDAARAAFSSSTDLVKAYKADAEETARGQVKAAQERLDTAKEQMANLQARQSDKERLSIADEQALARARKEVAGATKEVKDAQDLVLTGGQQVQKFYVDQVAQASRFSEGIRTAIQRGLDPQLVARLLQAGPEQATPILQAILSDHSGRLIGLVNDGETKLRDFNSLVVEMARLTQLAVSSAGDQMARDLGTAMAIAQAQARDGGQLTARALAEAIKVPEDEVNRIATEFGITLAKGVQASVSAQRIVVSPEFIGPLRPNEVRQLGPAYPGRARGGRMLGGRSYWVGEEGPELLHVGATAPPAYITSHEQSMAMAKDGPGLFADAGLLGRRFADGGDYMLDMPRVGRGGAGDIDYDRLADLVARNARSIRQENTTVVQAQDMPSEAAIDYANRVNAFRLHSLTGG